MSEPIYISSGDEDNKSPQKASGSSSNCNSTQESIVNEKQKVDEIFDKFIEACEKHVNDSEGLMILKHLQKKHNDNASKLASREYRRTITYSLRLLVNGMIDVYKAVDNVHNELRKHGTAKKRRISIDSPAVEVKRTRSMDTVRGVVVSDNEEKEEMSPVQVKLKKKEAYLKKLKKEICRLQQQELSLDDLDSPNSAYINESDLKKRAIKVHKKICKLRKVPVATGRIIEQKIRVQASRFEEINKKVMKYINGPKPLILQFPNYHDIVGLVNKANESRNLCLSSPEVKQEAINLFKEVGRQLQKRRVKDFMYEFGDNLPTPSDNVFDEKDDPASKDEDLMKKLIENKKRFQDRTKEVFSKYSGIQTEIEGTKELSKEQTEDIQSDGYDEENDGNSSESETENTEESDLTMKNEDQDEIIYLDDD